MSLATDAINFDALTQQVLAADGVLTATMIPFAIAQNRLETNNYTSNVFLTDNNLDGYKYVEGDPLQYGPGLTSTEGDPYADFIDVEDSAHEISAWWNRRVTEDGFNLASIQTMSDYVNALAQFQWFQSSPTAYLARMQAVSALINLENTTGINTQGTSLTTLSFGTIAIVGVGLWLLFGKRP